MFLIIGIYTGKANVINCLHVKPHKNVFFSSLYLVTHFKLKFDSKFKSFLEMESEENKQGISFDNSNSNSNSSDRMEEETTITKRSYECTFCKRGFTNAQALGGHMNIHRKDRAKNKQIVTTSSSSFGIKLDDQRNISTIEQAKYYSVFEAQKNFFVSNPRDHHRHHNHPHVYCSEFRIPTPLMGVNLSLGIGSDTIEDAKKDELDLELRLGYKP